MPTAYILSQGDEVVTGQTVDTNAAWLARELVGLGFTVLGHLAVPDVSADIQGAILQAAGAAAVVVCTGGLGPTDDDLTAVSAARAFGVELELHPRALERIQAFFDRIGRPMAASNRKQAMLPAGARCLPNPRGTAPGFALPAPTGAHLFFLPGVPSEMRGLFRDAVVPLLAGLGARPGRLVTLRTTGTGESTLQDRIGAFAHPTATLHTRCMLGENQLKLRFTADTPDHEVRRVVAELAERVGRAVFAVDGLDGPGGSLPETVGRRLAERGHTLAAAESCTGGRVASLCTGVAGASGWFLEGVVTYANAAKVRLGVPEPLLVAHGAVSEPVALAMARSVRERAGSTWGLSTTGVAGPGGGTPDKPVGTVHIAVSGPGGDHHRRLDLPGDRDRIQARAAFAVLDLLRRSL